MLAAGAVEATPEPTTPPPPVYVIYTVQAGDTVDGLAARYGISSTSVLWSNPALQSADSLALGDYLRIPMSDGIVYDVSPGDTLSDLAARFDVDVQAIIDFPGNNLASADSIAEGQTIFIPGGTISAPVATATPTPQPTEQPTAGPGSAASHRQPFGHWRASSGSGALARRVALRRGSRWPQRLRLQRPRVLGVLAARRRGPALRP